MVKAHKKIRSSCKACPHHHPTRAKYGAKGEHRFHGHGSFCRTHHTTKVGKKYCKGRKKR